jgi:hypothetical protein
VVSRGLFLFLFFIVRQKRINLCKHLPGLFPSISRGAGFPGNARGLVVFRLSTVVSGQQKAGTM